MLWFVAVTATVFDCFSALSACIASLNTMEPRPPVGGFQVSCNLNPSSPAWEICSVFNNRVLPSNSGKKPRAMVVIYTVWEDLKHPKFMPGIGGLLNNLWI